MLERALERLKRELGPIEATTLGDLVDVYLAQHGGEPQAIEKLRWGSQRTRWLDRKIG